MHPPRITHHCCLHDGGSSIFSFPENGDRSAGTCRTGRAAFAHTRRPYGSMCRRASRAGRRHRSDESRSDSWRCRRLPCAMPCHYRRPLFFIVPAGWPSINRAGRNEESGRTPAVEKISFGFPLSALIVRASFSSRSGLTSGRVGVCYALAHGTCRS